MSTFFQSSESHGNCIDSKLGQCYNVQNRVRLVRRLSAYISKNQH